MVTPLRPRPRPGTRASRRLSRTGLALGAAALAGALAACGGAGTTPAPEPPTTPAAEVSLARLAAAAGKDIGFATGPEHLGETALRQIVDTQATLVTPENVMKWEYTEPAQGQFDFAQGDDLVAYAQATGKKVYGHNLVWHEQLPAWTKDLDATELAATMENHVTQQAAHFRGKVVAWDVVNEAFDDDGTRRDDSVFQRLLGDGYVEDAFRTARAADPHARLCYNDYNIEWFGPKSDAVYAMVRDFKARGVPIDCVGFQSHFPVGGVPQDFVENLERFVGLGVDVRVTELDVRVPTPASEADLVRAADDYRTVVVDCIAVAGCQGVTIWGVTDRYSWVPDVFPDQGDALVWDAGYAKKPAFDAIAGALRAAPTATPRG